jgi:hypothetical protein
MAKPTDASIDPQTISGSLAGAAELNLPEPARGLEPPDLWLPPAKQLTSSEPSETERGAFIGKF